MTNSCVFSLSEIPWVASVGESIFYSSFANFLLNDNAVCCYTLLCSIPEMSAISTMFKAPAAKRAGQDLSQTEYISNLWLFLC